MPLSNASRLLRRSLLALALATPFGGMADVLKVDFSIDDRPDSIDPQYEQWMLLNPVSEQRSFGDVTFTVSRSGAEGSGLAAEWWKGGAAPGALMSIDGIVASEGVIELRIEGLTPGRHTLVSYHNTSAGDPERVLAPITISVDGTAVAKVRPSHRVRSDYDAALAYLEFEAHEGREVLLRFESTPDNTFGEESAVVLSGFVLDAPNPAHRAGKPSPLDGDEHVAAENGAVTLAWRPAKTAFTHHVYFGKDEAAVAAATPASTEYRGARALPEHREYELNVHDDYFWRIDEVDKQGNVTPGEVWNFRNRRLAFPGAEGHGRFARGGRGGRVIEVTNLNDSGPGSLRAAVQAEGPRTVVFAVSGLITLERGMGINDRYLTIAGQTAPGKGITIRKFGFGMSGGEDVIVRHLRVRPGSIAGRTLDGMGMQGSNHCIIDHCSISWTLDEAFSSRAAQNITLQNTLISEALNVAGHSNYPEGSQHGYAASISGRIGSFHHNLLAHNSGRNWSLAGGLDQANRHTGWLDIRNNVVYNWQNRTTDGGAARVNFVNNYYKPGPASRVFHLLKPERNNIAGFGPQNYFVEGNIMEGHVAADDALGGVIEPDPEQYNDQGDGVLAHDDAIPAEFVPFREFIVDQPFFDSHVETQRAMAAYKIVLSDVGANRPRLDGHDARVIRETLTGTTTFRGSKTGLPGIPDNEEDVGGWEAYPEVHRPAGWDSDHDGMPDWWERLQGLNPHSAAGDFSESNAYVEADGYTHLEQYLHWMARPHVMLAGKSSEDLDLSQFTAGFTAEPVHRVSARENVQVQLLKDGKTVRITPASGFSGLAQFTFSVTDAEGDRMSRTVGVLVP